MRSDRSIAWSLYFIVLSAYAYFFGGGGWNQNVNFALTRALVEDHSIAIDRFRSVSGDLSTSGGRVYANKAPGLSLVAAAPYAMARGVEQLFGISPASAAAIRFNAYFCTVIVCGSVTALIAPTLFLYVRRRYAASRRRALALVFIAAFATPLFAYSTLFMAHAPSAALLWIAFVYARDESERSVAWSGFSAGVAAMMNYLCLPVIAVFALRACFAAGRERRAPRFLLFLSGSLPPLLLLGLYQNAAFGNPFRTPIETMDAAFVSKDAFWLGIIRPPSLEALWGITLSPYRGMFYLSPVLILALLGAVLMLRSRERIDSFSAMAVIALYFAFNVTFNGWEGGFSIGARYLVPTLPLFVLLLLPAINRKTRAIALALTIAAVSNNFAAAAVDPQPSGSIFDPLGQYIYPLLFTGRFDPIGSLHPNWSRDYITGHSSVVRQTFEEIIPFVKYRPGSPETEWASFNLGEFLTGPGRAASLLPLLLIVIAMVILWRRCDEQAVPTATDALQ